MVGSFVSVVSVARLLRRAFIDSSVVSVCQSTRRQKDLGLVNGLHRISRQKYAFGLFHFFSLLRHLASWRRTRISRPKTVQSLWIAQNTALRRPGIKGIFGAKHSPIRLDARMRSAVATAIDEVCNFRKYRLIALQVRTNHGHCVVSANAKPEFVMNSFKSYATRKLVSSGLVAAKTKVWSRHGSTRYLWTEEQIAAAAEYVVNGQGDELPSL